MKRSRKTIIGLMVLIMWIIGAKGAIDASLEPYQYILPLQRLQDQIVSGDEQAHSARQKMLKYMADNFAKVRIIDWQKKRNAEALLIFLLSGGDPGIASRLAGIKNQPNLPKGALAGALAFVVGDFKQAQKLLDPVNAEAMSVNAGAQIALVKARLLSSSDHKKALDFLAKVRLWMPGTLLEEVALRRSLSLAIKHNDRKRFLMWSSQYTRRFSKSFYLPNFISQFSYYVARLDFSTQPKLPTEVGKILDPLSRNHQASVYLTVARAAVLNGKNAQAEFMARKALALLKDSPKYSARAMLYLAGSQIATKRRHEAIALLSKIDKKLLEIDDRKIFDAAGLMIEQIQRKPLDQPLVMRKKVKEGDRRKPGERYKEQSSPTLIRAQKLVESVEKLLEVTQQ